MPVIPKKEFLCPHCGLEQTRVWPYESGNLCNRCQKPMDAPPEGYESMLNSLADELERTDPGWVKEVGEALKRFNERL